MKLTTREIVGIILWWAEGTKSRRDKRWQNARNYPVEVTNTNPAIIQIILNFLREDIGIDENRMHMQLQIHEGDDQEDLEQYWSNITGIPSNRFNKTIVRPAGNKIGKSKGTCKIRFVDKETYLKMEILLQKVLRDLYDNPNEVLKTLPHYEFIS
jgi:hypothetical protein